MFFVITYVLGLTQYMKFLPCKNPFVQQPRIDPGRVFLEQGSAHFVLAKVSCSSVWVTAELLLLGFATGSKHPVNGCNCSPSPFAITPFLMRAVVGWGGTFSFSPLPNCRELKTPVSSWQPLTWLSRLAHLVFSPKQDILSLVLGFPSKAEKTSTYSLHHFSL